MFDVKVLDAKELHSGIKKTGTSLQTLDGQIKDVQRRVNEFVALDDAFTGKGAESIRSFYRELHVPFLLFMEGFIADYQDALKGMKRSLRSLEADDDGFIHEGFLENDLVSGLKKAEQTTMALTDEANAAMKSVRDIVALPKLDDEEFLFNVAQGRSQIYDTVEKLGTYDAQQTAKLENVEQDIQVMKNYIDQISGKLSSGELSIANYSVKQLSGNEKYDKLLAGVRNKAGVNVLSLDALLTFAGKEFLTHYLKLPVPGFIVDRVMEKLGFRTMDYRMRSIKTFLAVKRDSITAEEFATVQTDGTNSEEVSDYKGELRVDK